jgi:hypothetical protein
LGRLHHRNHDRRGVVQRSSVSGVNANLDPMNVAPASGRLSRGRLALGLGGIKSSARTYSPKSSSKLILKVTVLQVKRFFPRRAGTRPPDSRRDGGATLLAVILSVRRRPQFRKLELP